MRKRCAVGWMMAGVAVAVAAKQAAKCLDTDEHRSSYVKRRVERIKNELQKAENELFERRVQQSYTLPPR